MKLKQRDINTLIIIGILLVVFLSYFVGFRNLMDKNNAVSDEVAALKQKYDKLVDNKARVDDYEKEIDSYNEQIEELYAEFDSGACQEYTIKFLEGTENGTNSWIKTATIKQPEQIYTFGNITSSNPISYGEVVYETDYIGYKVETTLAFETSYSSFKNLIDYIIHNQYKCTLESLSVSYNSADDIVSGSFVLSQFAIDGDDREFGQVYTSNQIFGTENIFSSSVFNPTVVGEENGSDIMSDYDLFLSLQSYETDSAALKMGFKTDSTKTITNEDNDVKDVTVKITGEEGDYRISYKVGNVTYPTTNYNEGAEFVPGVKLSMLINSSQRTSVNDVSGANVTIINESDKTLYIKVINEDESMPRFKIEDKQGDVVIYQD